MMIHTDSMNINFDTYSWHFISCICVREYLKVVPSVIQLLNVVFLFIIWEFYLHILYFAHSHLYSSSQFPNLYRSFDSSSEEAVYYIYKKTVNGKGLRDMSCTYQRSLLRRTLIAQERSNKMMTVSCNISHYLRAGETGE